MKITIKVASKTGYISKEYKTRKYQNHK